MHKEVTSYKQLIVWQRASELSVAVYVLTERFPAREQYHLAQQMRDAATSIPSNIAEGRHRNTRKEYLRFLYIAYASGAELETQIFIAKKLPETLALDYQHVNRLLLETMKMLNSMIQKLQYRSRKPEANH